jgi:predicted Zn-dependent protease
MSVDTKRTATRWKPRVFLALAGVAALGAWACAINPATGKKQISLIGERDEIAMGRAEDERIVATLGLYGGTELQSYVQRIGQRLAADSERPDLPWTFRVVDDASVNAFALPGGYIYVTRGIMAHLNSEAQLAAVLGHEIGHVTARHSVNQMSKAQLATLGLGIGSVLSEDVREFGDLAQVGLGLLFLKYSRDDERQADELGLRYVVNSNYDPRPMADVFGMLDRLGESTTGGRTPAWLSTHPAPASRQADIQKRIAALSQDFSGHGTEQAAYYRQIDGMVYGPNPREGFFRDTLFLHPDLRFQMDFPHGYQTVNEKTSVIGVSPQQDAVIELTLAPGNSPDAALSAFAKQQGVQLGSEWASRINGMPAASRHFTVVVEGRSVRGVVAFVSYVGKVYRLLGYTPGGSWAARDSEIQKSLASFDRLKDPSALDVQPMRLDIVDLHRTVSLSGFAKTYGAVVDVSTLALINNVGPDATLQAGHPYKVVVEATG